MPTATCHCGAVRIELDGPPAYLNECQCSVCRRYGVAWGYYHPDAVRVVAAAGALQAYGWNGHHLAFHRCRTCGNVTHWTSNEPAPDRLGVNARLVEPEELAGVPIRRSPGPPD